MKWKTVRGGNELLSGEGFFISYQDFSNGFIGGVGGVFGPDDGKSPETALCKGGKFYILNGNFKEEYEKLVPEGYEACYAFYKANIENKSSWSN